MSDFHPFRDMKESVKAQHELDKANFEAAKAQAKASWAEAKMSPKGRAALQSQKRDEAIAVAKAKVAEAQERINFAQEHKNGQ